MRLSSSYLVWTGVVDARLMAKEYCLRCIQTSANKQALPRIVKELTTTIARVIALADDVISHVESVTRTMNELAQSTNILLIDDDQELGAMLRDFLAADHLMLTASNTGENGLQAFAEGEFDLLILDIMLPGISGLDVLKKIRQKSNVPVIMLTARGDDIDRIIGLEFGADDYLAKPFNPRELVARIKAILRRAKQTNSDHQQLSLGGIDLSPLFATLLLLVAKIKTSLFKDLEKAVKKLHSYDVPEVILLPIEAGANNYLEWIRQVTK